MTQWQIPNFFEIHFICQLWMTSTRFNSPWLFVLWYACINNIREILVIRYAVNYIVQTMLYKLEFTIVNNERMKLLRVRKLFDHQKCYCNDSVIKINFLVLMAEGMWLVVVVAVPHSLYLTRFSQVMRLVDCVSYGLILLSAV